MHSSVGTDIGYLGRFSELLCEFARKKAPRVPFAKSQFFEAVEARYFIESRQIKKQLFIPSATWRL
jgi:hypothetical protein